MESLEGRLLFSESASAQLTLVSTGGTNQSPVYTYDVALTNTGTTNIGTFWMSWIPGENFLPSVPSSQTNPAGWSNSLQGPGDNSDGTSIQWVAQNGADLQPGLSLSGFNFTTTDSPSALAGNSPVHPAAPVLTSFVYGGGPLSDAGFQFAVTPVQTNTQNDTTTVLSASTATSTAGDLVTLTATVIANAPGAPTPTGNVEFVSADTTLGVVPLSPNGTASLTTASLPVGTMNISAHYDGDVAFNASVSAPVTEVVNPRVTGAAATTTTLAGSSPLVAISQPVALTATVIPAIPGSAAPTGTVTFLDGADPIGSVAVAANGAAVLDTSSLALGDHSITASYTGDSAYAPSVSTPVVETVFAPVLLPEIANSTVPSDFVSGTAAHGVVTLDVSNQTASVVKGKFKVDLYATSDGVIDNASIKVATAVRRLNLKGSNSIVAPVHVGPQALKRVPAGSYLLLARTTDPLGNVVDSTTGPALNVAIATIAFSETFARLTLPASAAAGSKVHAAAVLQISNAGNITSTGLSSIAIYASPDGTVGAGAMKINSVTRPLHIRAGKAANVLIPLKQIPPLAPGSYFIVAQVIDGRQQTTSVVSAATLAVG